MIKSITSVSREALDYGANWAGLAGSKLGFSGVVQPASTKTMTSPFSHAKQDELNEESKTKIAKTQALWNKGFPIQGTLAGRYLREHRKIEGSLPSDLRYLPSFKDQSSGKNYPCLMSAARDVDENITAI